MEGLKRGICFLEQNDINIRSFTTDRHSSIKKYLRVEKPEIKHWFDVWPMAKGNYSKCTEKSGTVIPCQKRIFFLYNGLAIRHCFEDFMHLKAILSLNVKCNYSVCVPPCNRLFGYIVMVLVAFPILGLLKMARRRTKDDALSKGEKRKVFAPESMLQREGFLPSLRVTSTCPDVGACWTSVSIRLQRWWRRRS